MKKIIVMLFIITTVVLSIFGSVTYDKFYYDLQRGFSCDISMGNIFGYNSYYELIKNKEFGISIKPGYKLKNYTTTNAVNLFSIDNSIIQKKLDVLFIDLAAYQTINGDHYNEKYYNDLTAGMEAYIKSEFSGDFFKSAIYDGVISLGYEAQYSEPENYPIGTYKNSSKISFNFGTDSSLKNRGFFLFDESVNINQPVINKYLDFNAELVFKQLIPLFGTMFSFDKPAIKYIGSHYDYTGNRIFFTESSLKGFIPFEYYFPIKMGVGLINQFGIAEDDLYVFDINKYKGVYGIISEVNIKENMLGINIKASTGVVWPYDNNGIKSPSFIFNTEISNFTVFLFMLLSK